MSRLAGVSIMRKDYDTEKRWRCYIRSHCAFVNRLIFMTFTLIALLSAHSQLHLGKFLRTIITESIRPKIEKLNETQK